MICELDEETLEELEARLYSQVYHGNSEEQTPSAGTDAVDNCQEFNLKCNKENDGNNTGSVQKPQLTNDQQNHQLEPISNNVIQKFKPSRRYYNNRTVENIKYNDSLEKCSSISNPEVMNINPNSHPQFIQNVVNISPIIQIHPPQISANPVIVVPNSPSNTHQETEQTVTPAQLKKRMKNKLRRLKRKQLCEEEKRKRQQRLEQEFISAQSRYDKFKAMINATRTSKFHSVPTLRSTRLQMKSLKANNPSKLPKGMQNDIVVFISDDETEPSKNIKTNLGPSKLTASKAIYNTNINKDDAKTVKTNVCSSTNIIDPLDDDVIFIEPKPVDIINVDEEDLEPIVNIDSKSIADADAFAQIETAKSNSLTSSTTISLHSSCENNNSPDKTATRNQKRNSQQMNRSEVLRTPDSAASNDFIDNNLIKQSNNFNYVIPGVDFADTFIKPRPLNELYESESSASDVSTPSKPSGVFSEVAFDSTEKALFGEENLQSFSDFITPKRRSELEVAENASTSQASTSNQCVLPTSPPGNSHSISESDRSRSRGQTRKKRLPSLCAMPSSEQSSTFKKTATAIQSLESNNSSESSSESDCDDDYLVPNPLCQKANQDVPKVGDSPISTKAGTSKTATAQLQNNCDNSCEARNEGVRKRLNIENNSPSSSSKRRRKSKSTERTENVDETSNITEATTSFIQSSRKRNSHESDWNSSKAKSQKTNVAESSTTTVQSDQIINSLNEQDTVKNVVNQVETGNNDSGAINNEVQNVEVDDDVCIIEVANDPIVLSDEDDDIVSLNVETDLAILNVLNENKAEDQNSQPNESTQKKTFSDYYTSDKEQFYTTSWGLENFSVDEAQKHMSSDPNLWKILDRDRNEIRLPTAKRGRCHRCREPGHYAVDCPNKTGPPICKLCGRKGHIEIKCQNKLCSNCGRKGEYSTVYCENCVNDRTVKCRICQSRGHTPNRCPDLWRRYAYTINSGPPLHVEHVSLKPNTLRWCSGCGGNGHLEYECTHYNRTYPRLNPSIKGNEDVYEGGYDPFQPNIKPEVSTQSSSSQSLTDLSQPSTSTGSQLNSFIPLEGSNQNLEIDLSGKCKNRVVHKNLQVQLVNDLKVGNVNAEIEEATNQVIYYLNIPAAEFFLYNYPGKDFIEQLQKDLKIYIEVVIQEMSSLAFTKIKGPMQIINFAREVIDRFVHNEFPNLRVSTNSKVVMKFIQDNLSRCNRMHNPARVLEDIIRIELYIIHCNNIKEVTEVRSDLRHLYVILNSTLFSNYKIDVAEKHMNLLLFSRDKFQRRDQYFLTDNEREMLQNAVDYIFYIRRSVEEYKAFIRMVNQIAPGRLSNEVPDAKEKSINAMSITIEQNYKHFLNAKKKNNLPYYFIDKMPKLYNNFKNNPKRTEYEKFRNIYMQFLSHLRPK